MKIHEQQASRPEEMSIFFGIKNFLKLNLCIAAFLLLAGVSSAKEIDLGIKVGTPFDKAGQKVEVVKYNDKTAIRLEWDAEKKAWAEFGWLGKSPSWDMFGNLKIRITVQAGKLTRPLDMMARFTDREGEVFPLNSGIQYDDSGRGIAEFKLTYLYKAKNTWGNNPKTARKNEILDLPVSLTGISVGYPPKSGQGEIYITSIDVEIEPLPVNERARFSGKNLSPICFDIVTDHPVRVVTPVNRNFCYGVVFNSENKRKEINVQLSVRDLNGNAVGEKISAPEQIGSLSRRFYQIPIPEKFGIYYVDAEIEVPDDPAARTKITRSFAYLSPSGHVVPYQKGEFRFGVNTHWKQDPATWTIEAEACRTVGIRFVRDGFGIEVLHPRPGYWFHPQYDAVIDFFLSYGIQPELIMHGSAAWAVQNPADSKRKPHASMPRLDVWREFCEEVFRHYGNRISAFEIWNEPDLETFALFSVEEYRQLVEIAYKAHKLYAPQTELMSAGFCNFNNRGGFHENAMRLCKKFFDIHCFHGHGPPEPFQYMIDHQLMPMRHRLGIDAIPWYAHETALTAVGYGEKLQAEALFKKLIFSWSRGAIGYTWYDLRNDGFDPDNPEHNYGMLTNDYYPKAVYVVYNTLTSLLAGDTKFEKDFSDGRGLNAYQFRRGNEILVAAWQARSGVVSDLTLKTDARTSEIVDLQGNSSLASRSGELVILPVSNEPVALWLKTVTRCEPTPGIVFIKEKSLYFRNGEPVCLMLNCFNPFLKTVKLDFTIKCPPGITAKQLPQLVLAPGEKKTIPAELVCDRTNLLPDSNIRFSYQTSEGQRGESGLPVNLIYSLPKEFATKPFTDMNRREQIVELFNDDPGNLFRLWKGPEDLSAKVWIAADEKTFKLRVEVTDDFHKQPNRGSEIWKGDSLQVFCAFPGQNWVWQFGCALLDDNKVEPFVWCPAKGLSPAITALDCKVTRQGNLTVYNLQVPWLAFGVAPEILKQGFRFNLMLNESDSNVRESWMALAPGVGTVVNPEMFPILEWQK